MNQVQMGHFRDLVAQRFGLINIPLGEEQLAQRLQKRINAWGHQNLDGFFFLLANDTQQSHQEWRNLLPWLTTGESYFFRDDGQCQLLKKTLIPQLLAESKQKLQQRGLLRIWSAGCSTGEEPYSLAILCDQLLATFPDEHYKVEIIASDINEECLEHAREGIYSNWSFRRTPPALKQQYFIPLGAESYQLNSQIRSMVRFERSNLVYDTFPNIALGLAEFDLILCRNVFIYFDQATIAKVVAKMAKSLRIDGLLLTGHAELGNLMLPDFDKRLYPESMVYQRTLQVPKPPHLPTNKAGIFSNDILFNKQNMHFQTGFSSPFRSKPSAQDVLEQQLKDLNQLLLAGNNKAVLEQKNAIQGTFTSLDNNQKTQYLKQQWHLIIARAYANLGELLLARQICYDLLQHDPFSDDGHYLLAHIAHEQGDLEEAQQYLNKVLFLNPSHVAALMEMAELRMHAGLIEKAQALRQAALSHLETCLDNTQVPFLEEWPVEVLVQQLREYLPLQAVDRDGFFAH